MARCLIVGCGCRGRLLARELVARGHAVRGTTRDPGRLAEIEAAGAEPVLADPARVATLTPALEHVAVTCLLLGQASAEREQLNQLHGPRLEMLLARMVDTTIRAVVYEVPGGFDAADRVRRACTDARIPYALLRAKLIPYEEWATAAADTVDEVLARGATPR